MWFSLYGGGIGKFVKSTGDIPEIVRQILAWIERISYEMKRVGENEGRMCKFLSNKTGRERHLPSGQKSSAKKLPTFEANVGRHGDSRCAIRACIEMYSPLLCECLLKSVVNLRLFPTWMYQLYLSGMTKMISPGLE